ncbi:mitochondrial potassium channel ATP-binding subunit-like [Ascaphus truei]|uniref:mitochondrial potassium channel ATP-binding subunit-like n=1 Tax=Ascaphus truei TaxID=8439 RepID=UPI003F5A52CF
MLLRLLQAGLRRCPPRLRFVRLDTHVSGLRRSAASRLQSSPSLRLYARLRDAARCPPGRTFSKGRTLALLLGPGLACVGGRVAQCQLELDNNHPLVAPGKSRPEPEFNWGEFWKLLRPQLGALVAAVILAFAASVLNVQIPLMLGQLVNVVSRYTREHAGNYVREVWGPGMKLLRLYGAQVSGTYLLCNKGGGGQEGSPHYYPITIGTLFMLLGRIKDGVRFSRN